MTLPTIMTSAGLQPQAPADLRAQLVAAVAATNPGYTSDLPGSLVEDIVSTDVAATVLCDQARVELVNSVSPYGCNAFILNQLGAMLGIPQGAATNTSVGVVFTGTPGLVIPVGFTVSDGSHQFVVRDGGVIPAGGVSLPLYALAALPGSFAVTAGSVTTLVTSTPYTIGLAVTNPLAGVPGAAAQSEEDYRTQVLQGYRASAQGMPTYIRTLLENVAGVQARLVSIRQVTAGWQMIVGGGDPYQVAYAIFEGMFDLSRLTGSTISSARNQVVSLSDPPDVYSVTFVLPSAQTVGIVLTWNTIAVNFVAAAAVAALGNAALVAYVNSLPVGQPMNLFEMQAVFQAAIATVVAPQLLTRMVFVVSVNGVAVPPSVGTGMIVGDSESYFLTTPAAIIVTQG